MKTSSKLPHFLSKVCSKSHRPFLKNQWVKGMGCFLVTLIGISQLSHHVSLVYSRTHSLPYRLFLTLKHVPPQKGQYTCFDCPWYGGRIVKKVVGIGGDTLFYDDQKNLWIEWIETVARDPRIDPYSTRVTFLKIGPHHKRSKKGRLLTPIKPGVIPEGKVFVVGEHERSFDSRYAELGLIAQKDLQGRLLAIL